MRQASPRRIRLTIPKPDDRAGQDVPGDPLYFQLSGPVIASRAATIVRPPRFAQRPPKTHLGDIAEFGSGSTTFL